MNAGAGIPNGAVYLAEHQSAGRGQGPNRWHATPSANLTLSAASMPDHLAVADLFLLTAVAALAVADAVRPRLPPGTVTVKWPNDVYAGNQKLAGVLIQNGLRGQRIAWSVTGIGLNVNEADFPPELTATATSLRLLTGRDHDREALLTDLLAALSARYAQTHTAPGRAILLAEYHEHLYRRHQPADFREVATRVRFRGRILGVSPDGRLRIDVDGAGERRFALRELRYLFTDES